MQDVAFLVNKRWREEISFHFLFSFFILSSSFCHSISYLKFMSQVLITSPNIAGPYFEVNFEGNKDSIT